TFLPLLGRMGPRVTATLERPGFYPAGGGRLRVEVTPCARLQPLMLEERGAILRRRARAGVANLPRSIAERELHRRAGRPGWQSCRAFSTCARPSPRRPTAAGVSRSREGVCWCACELALIAD